MAALQRLLLVLALPGFEALAVTRGSRRVTAEADSGNIYYVFDKPSSRCTLPPSLAIRDPGHNRQQLLDAVASPLRKTKPFLWLHYGDGDFMSMTGADSFSAEGADMTSQCVRDGVAQMFLGSGSKKEHSVYQALGAFFLCNETHPDLHGQVEKFGKAHPEHKYAYVNDFYFPVGTEESSPKNSWVVAAQQAKRPIVIVGPKHLDSLHCMLRHKAFFEIPIPTQGCGDVDRLVPQLIEFSKTHYPSESVLFVVAGASIGKMIAYKAFQSLKYKDMFVDVGASLDAYAGRDSREYNGNLARLCLHSKRWMEFETCKFQCDGGYKWQPDVPCQRCEGTASASDVRDASDVVSK